MRQGFTVYYCTLNSAMAVTQIDFKMHAPEKYVVIFFTSKPPACCTHCWVSPISDHMQVISYFIRTMMTIIQKKNIHGHDEGRKQHIEHLSCSHVALLSTSYSVIVWGISQYIIYA